MLTPAELVAIVPGGRPFRLTFFTFFILRAAAAEFEMSMGRAGAEAEAEEERRGAGRHMSDGAFDESEELAVAELTRREIDLRGACPSSRGEPEGSDEEPAASASGDDPDLDELEPLSSSLRNTWFPLPLASDIE